MERRFIMILMIDLDKSVFYLSSQIRLGAITSYEPALMTSKDSSMDVFLIFGRFQLLIRIFTIEAP